VTHHNSKVLVQLAKYDVEAEESMQVKCQLPAVKQVDNESWPEAAERLLLSMRNVVGSVDLSTSTQEIECKHSQGVGVRTKYLRTTCVGHMTATPEELNQRGRPGGRSVIKRSLLPYQSTQPVKVQKVDCPNAFGLNDEEVYITGRNGKVYFYAWLAQLQFEELCQREDLLEPIIATIDFDPEEFNQASKVNTPGSSRASSPEGSRSSQSQPSQGEFRSGIDVLLDYSSQSPRGALLGDISPQETPRGVGSTASPVLQDEVLSRSFHSGRRLQPTSSMQRSQSSLVASHSLPDLEIEVIASQGRWNEFPL